ncbi:MAG: tetratricopeptide repeat protein [Planctomycetes bacterium]|nr:tetratricopeptide repeat protein [Planctomycetota bacterium]
MTRHVHEIFNEARELAGAQRAAYLLGACGNDVALRTKVEALLEADAQAGEFLASPTRGGGVGAGVSPSLPKEQAGAQIDRYRLLEQIGEGGMGTIWMAEQREPVKRRVALKVIKLGMDTKQVIARFEAERQALAMMDHPNIAKVLDAGATETGRPYFVMEYIKGIPILQYCDQEKVDTRARLGLFAKVCHAIQHAHQKGIIHRDIKPSNVLVTLHDGVPVPKVIDFGIAKATNSELTSKTLFTEHRQMVGTPAYMSPEQAEMSGLDIDTRSDVYSLGVLLYELLTGTTPFDIKALLESGFGEMLRAIREDEPHKPSTRISSLGETGTRTALQRNVDVKRLSTMLRGDIDWIVMKCLEKDRTRRYETANGLAADILRHLNDEPVTAGAPSASYILRKFVRRNRGQVLAGSAIVLALLAGVVAFAWKAKEASEQRDEAVLAREAEAEQRRQADAARAESETQRALAQAQEAEAKRQEAEARKQEIAAETQAAIAEAVAKFQTDMLAAVDPNQLPMDPVTHEPLKDKVTVVQALQAAVQALGAGSLADQPLVEARVRDTIGTTFMGLGRFDEAEPNLRSALAIRSKVLPAGDLEIALSQNNLAVLLESQNKLPEAEALHRAALEIARTSLPAGHPDLGVGLNNLAEILRIQGKLADAEPLYLEALAIARATSPEGHPDIADRLDNLAQLLQAQRRLDEAEPLQREALAIRLAAFPAEHPQVARGLNNLALVLVAQDKLPEAEALLREALEIRNKSLPAGHIDIASGLDNLAVVLQKRGKLVEAESMLREAIELRRKTLSAGHLYRAQGLNNLGTFLLTQNKLEEAESLYLEVLEIRRNSLPVGHPDIATAIDSLGIVYWRQGRLDQSIPLFEQALDGRAAALGRLHPDTLSTIANLGVNYLDAGRIAEAVPLLEEASAGAAHEPSLAWVASRLLDAYIATVDPGRPESVARFLNLAHDQLALSRTRLPKDSPELAGQLAALSTVLLRARAWTAAEPLLRECLAIREQVLPDVWSTFNAKSMLGEVLLGQNKLSEAEALLLDGYRGLQERAPSLPAGVAARIPEALDRLVRLYETTGDAEQAKVWREKLEAARAALPTSGTEGK